MVERIGSDNVALASPESLVNACLDQVGAISVNDDTRRVLVGFAEQGGDVLPGSDGADEGTRRRIAEVLQVVASTQEFQRL